MTCIVGAVYKDGIYMVADSSSVDEDFNVRTTKDEKVFHKTLESDPFLTEDILIGMAGSWRAIHLIKHGFTFPTIKSTTSLERYVSIHLIDALKEKYRDDGLRCDDDRPNPAEMLIGIRGQMFHVDSWYQVCHFDDIPFQAIGIGTEYCIGAANVMWNASNVHTPSEMEDILDSAIRTAAKFNARVRGPFYHHVLKPQGAFNLEVVA